jgi:hypothetical protein
MNISSTVDTGKRRGYADADGLETVAAYVCADGCPVALLGAQSGERASRSGATTRNGTPHYGGGWGAVEDGPNYHADTGTAARFYHNPDYALDIAERLAAAEPVFYAAKASRRERNAGCEGLPERDGASISGGGGTAHPKADAYQARKSDRRNPHPTVKPLALARHLATLLLPPDAYAPRRLFVPFAGSGSECIGATLAGWDEVVGVELSDEYADIARARLAWWEAQQPDATQPALPLAVNE